MNHQFLIYFILSCVLHTCCGQFYDHSMVKIFEEVVNKNVISDKCTKSINIFVERLRKPRNEDFWALKMLAASSKVPQSILSYNFEDLGHFTECIEVVSQQDYILGKYCFADVYFKNPYRFVGINKDLRLVQSLTNNNGSLQILGRSSWAFCIPSNCTDEDSKKLMKSVQISGIEIADITCQTNEEAYPKLSGHAILGLTLFGILLFIVISSTCFDIYWQKNKVDSAYYPILISFSVYTNGRKLFTLPRRSSNLACLDGLRVLSLMWTILFHIQGAFFVHRVFNGKDVINFRKSLLSAIFFDAGNLSCDSFFIIGGTLVTYRYFKKEILKNNTEDITRSSIIKHYLHRYIRLAPAVAGLILFSATLLRYMGSGPLWTRMINTDFTQNCVANWWSALLFIQNEIDDGKMCLAHTWYLDIDMQLYLFSPLIFLMLKKRFKTGVVLISLASFVSLAITMVRVLKSNLGSLTNYYEEIHFNTHIDKIYFNTETRMTPWLMGTLLGYALTKAEWNDIRLSKRSTLLLWLLSLTILVYCVLGGHHSLVSFEYARVQNALFITLFRPFFGLAVGWVIWACCNNHGGIYNTFLSLPIFQFLNKFNYSMYLIHFVVLFPLSAATKILLYADLLSLAQWFLWIYFLTFLISIVWVLIFEIPLVNVENYFFSR